MDTLLDPAIDGAPMSWPNPELGLTVTINGVDRVTPPLVPERVMVVVAASAAGDAVRVSEDVPLPVIDGGVKLAVTPGGRPDALNATVALKPPNAPTVTGAEVVEPGSTFTDGVCVLRPKSGPGATLRENVVVRNRLPPIPVIVMT